MNATLITKMADSVVEAARAYIDQRESVLLKRIAELEAREPIPGPPGKDAAPVDVEAVTAITFEKVMALIPPAVPGLPGKDGVNGKDGEPGMNGKDADPINKDALIGELLSKVVVPAGKDGKDGSDGKDGQNGEPGKDAPPVDIKALSAEILQEVIKAIPEPVPGKDGRDGSNGKDAEPIDVKQLADDVEIVVTQKMLAAIPEPIPGPAGKNGSDGKDAPPIDTEAVIKAVVAQIPPPKDGQQGPAGKDAPEINTKAIVADVLALVPGARDGKDGRDGKDADEKVIVEKVLEKVPPPLPGRDGMPGANGASGVNGKDGLPGKDGVDGFGLDDLSVEKLDDGRTLRLKLESGERSFIKDIRFDVPLYRDTYNPGREYEKSDMVTRHNEVWIAIVDKASEPPGGMSKQWRLAVRKGRDSKPVKLTD